MSQEQIDLRFDAPSAPGSASSQDAADAMRGKVQKERRRVLLWFAAQSGPRTRHECADVLYPYNGGIGPACGRVNELMAMGWLEEVGRKGRRATLRATEAGRRIIKQLVKAA